MQQLTPQLLESVLTIVRQAGEHLKRFYAQSVEIQIKADKTPVTEADLFISQFLIEQLQQLTPTIPVLSEENCTVPFAERSQWQEYWIIDPLDGTQQFINRTDQFSIMIALVQQHRPVLGVIHAPVLAKTYYALDQQGAYLVEQGQTRPLLPICKKWDFLTPLQITVGLSSCDKIAQSVQPPYQVTFIPYGSSSLKAGLVAEGKADCYVRFGDTGEWDTAAAEVLLAEIGGTIFDLRFQPLSYNRRETLVNPHFVMVNCKQIDWRKIFLFN